jgi:hypothetical protein
MVNPLRSCLGGLAGIHKTRNVIVNLLDYSKVGAI